MIIRQWIEENVARGLKRSELEILVCQILNSERAELVLHENDDLIAPSVQRKLDRLVERRIAGEPLAYILGYKEFYGRDFDVDENVLIPRPETEALVDVVLEQIHKKSDRKWQIIDVGTGSGCIATTLYLGLKKENVSGKIISLDVSKNALEIARKNCQKLVEAEKGPRNGNSQMLKIDFQYSDLLEKVDIMDDCETMIVANLPYVDKDWSWLDHKSLSFEPEQALFAGKKGCELIFRLINQVEEKVRRVRSKVYLALESDPSQQDEIINYANNHNMNFIKKQEYCILFSC